jgi:hypothetical protein
MLAILRFRASRPGAEGFRPRMAARLRHRSPPHSLGYWRPRCCAKPVIQPQTTQMFFVRRCASRYGRSAATPNASHRSLADAKLRTIKPCATLSPLRASQVENHKAAAIWNGILWREADIRHYVSQVPNSSHINRCGNQFALSWAASAVTMARAVSLSDPR